MLAARSRVSNQLSITNTISRKQSLNYVAIALIFQPNFDLPPSFILQIYNFNFQKLNILRGVPSAPTVSRFKHGFRIIIPSTNSILKTVLFTLYNFYLFLLRIFLPHHLFQ